MSQPGLTEALMQWLEAGGDRIGEIAIQPTADGWELRHIADLGVEELTLHTTPEAARHLANFTESGAFRPLKTAPTLRRGWVLRLADPGDLRRALDYLYPAMIGCAVSYRRGSLPPVVLRETLGRQTGMYRVTQKISDEDARRTIDRFCAGCLKQRLWEIAGPNPVPPALRPREWPLLCHEACNLLVAEIRTVVKQR